MGALLSGYKAGDPDVSVAGDGAIAVGWAQHGTGRGRAIPEVAYRSPAGRWRISQLDTRFKIARNVTVLALGGGQVFAAWVYPGIGFGDQM